MVLASRVYYYIYGNERIYIYTPRNGTSVLHSLGTVPLLPISEGPSHQATPPPNLGRPLPIWHLAVPANDKLPINTL